MNFRTTSLKPFTSSHFSLKKKNAIIRKRRFVFIIPIQLNDTKLFPNHSKLRKWKASRFNKGRWIEEYSRNKNLAKKTRELETDKGNVCKESFHFCHFFFSCQRLMERFLPSTLFSSFVRTLHVTCKLSGQFSTPSFFSVSEIFNLSSSRSSV